MAKYNDKLSQRGARASNNSAEEAARLEDLFDSRTDDDIAAAAAKPPAKGDKKPGGAIEIPMPKIMVAVVDIVGTAGLLCAKFPDKLLDQMQGIRETETMPGKKKKTIRPARDFDQEFRDSVYKLDDGSGYGFPSIAFKKAMVTACAQVDGLTMKLANQLFFVLGDAMSQDQLCTRITGKLHKVRHMVRLASRERPPDVRFRGEFRPWTATLRIKYNSNMITGQSILSLVQIAGTSGGVGEHRATSPLSTGDHGFFTVKELA